ncbi:MAG: GrpB family protein [Chloroflexota bacterium]
MTIVPVLAYTIPEGFFMVDDHIVGLQDGRVRLVPHSPEWARLFAEEKQRLQTALTAYMPDIVRDIQHVGSTSIPGIPAKPIIDIALVVDDFEKTPPVIETLQQMGYIYLGTDVVPGRHFFYLGEATTTGRTHHLHMFEQSSREWQQTTGFRDYLLAHPATAAAYGELKAELALEFAEDRPGYLDGKAPFITQVLRLSVLERPMLWTTVHDSETALSFRYSQDVVDQPVTLEHGRIGDSRRFHLLTADRCLLYFEVAVYEQFGDRQQAYEQFVAGLRDKFADLTTTELHDTRVGDMPAVQFGFAWDDMRREAVFMQRDDTLVRIIYDPRGPQSGYIGDCYLVGC